MNAEQSWRSHCLEVLSLRFCDNPKQLGEERRTVMKLRSTQNLFAAALVCVLSFCALAILPVAHAAAAKLIVSWKNPDYSGPKPHRVLVIGMSGNPEIRADFEDDL